MTKYLIIGNGTAAVSAIEGIRSVDKDGKITVISKEDRPAYCRPLISYYLEGRTDLEKMACRSEDFYKENNVELLLGECASSIDPEAKKVVLESGIEIEYDKLLVAAGSSPFVPPMKGLETVGKKCSFMTVDDALTLENETNSESRVLIVGAGLIGLKCAEGLKDRVKTITVCDLAPRVLSSILDDEASDMVKKRLEDNGIELLLGDTVSVFDGNKATMSSGKEIEFDMLVVAVGVRPNISLVKDAGGECTRAIKIDECMKTSLNDVYAAGDCTESVDISSGTVKIMALMPNANIQGRTAGINMAGGNASVDNSVPMNSIGFFGLHAMSAGSYEGEAQTVRSEAGLKKFFVKDGYLKGFIIIGDTVRAGIYTSLIRNSVPLDSVDFDSIKKDPNIFAFGEDYCRNKLHKVV